VEARGRRITDVLVFEFDGGEAEFFGAQPEPLRQRQAAGADLVVV
jgi:hypothetical protein